MQRLNEHLSYVDLEGEYEVREALMGISLLHDMAGGNTYPQWINEYEGVRYPANGENQGLRTDSARHAQVAFPVSLPAANANRDTPPSVTLTSSECGLRHGNPRLCTPWEHALRVNAMQHTYHEGDQVVVVTEPPETTEPHVAWGTMLMTNVLHAGKGADWLARLGLFLAAMQFQYLQSPFGPDKHNTTTAVVLAADYEPVDGLDKPDELEAMFASGITYVEQYALGVAPEEKRDGAVGIETGDLVMSLIPV
jgi:hypothetical protein